MLRISKLADDGTLWLNLGDSYSRHPRYGALPKSFLLGPERLALALVRDGWIIRNKVIWAKTGNSIFFTAQSAAEGKPEIMRIGIEGGKPQPVGITTTSVRNFDTFDVSPDGSRIAITSAARASTKELLVIDNLSTLLKDSK